MATVSSKEAVAHLIDPLTQPEPSAETGLNSHFTPASETELHSSPRNTTSTNPFRKSGSSSHNRHGSNGSRGSPPISGHNRKTSLNDQPPAYDASGSGHRRRSSSLRERFPGDESHKPLDIIRRDSKKAARSPHLNKRHMPGADSVDRLDPSISSVPYHHEGPYDAAMLSRNNDPRIAPVAALRDSNQEALKATPRENVKNSLERKVPLDGTAVVPPGVEDRFGRRYDYEEGGNMMLEGNPEGGEYKRYPGVYHPDDIKGKGEPSYSRDLALRAKEGHAGPYEQEHDGGIEMENTKHVSEGMHDEGEASGRARGNSLMGGLKKRIGSLKKK